ncbi:Uncharacterised protein [Yersinia pekkanenii]|uniref:Uncharacterized protein n=1 Tax=Yersinia pekkanenii TaxID=1288385 RepID=A0A0T9QWZ6_9GAMM|nr:Uncharacterised protein [Yersinia pekkanenii]CRY66210.1 Uncharacterised protein [Yersinia pekkanenii]
MGFITVEFYAENLTLRAGGVSNTCAVVRLITTPLITQ